MLLFIIGPSASGKGTQSELLSKKYNIPHISIGDLFRNEIANDTALGRQVKPILESGKFVPGNITLQILKGIMEKDYDTFGGAIIDGFPRLYSQAVEIQPVVDEHDGYFKVIHYTLSFDECLKRQRKREEMGGTRADDDVLKQRIDAYLEEVDMIKDYYIMRNQLFEINAEPSIEDIFNQTTMLIDNDIKHQEQYESI